MRAYTVAATAVTLKTSPKWVDNILSHHTVPGVSRARQGVMRRLTPRAVTTLEIALRIARSLALPMHRALSIAGNLIETGGSDASIQLSPTIRIVVNVDAIISETMARLDEAVEVTPVPKRGRPRR